MTEGRLEPAGAEFIDRIVREHWGTPVVCIDRLYEPGDLEGLVWRDVSGEIQGLVTWAMVDE
ncbi:MAG TPA: hypothetical protein VLS25_09715 [Dehalococcoidia bacterium]|nr:hypothetical protein [Dehalococcoidia bacterium]